MERLNAIFGASRGFDKALMISKLPDGIRESPTHKDLFMVHSNSSNYRLVDMSVCKCSCPNEKICSHIISILIRYCNTRRNYTIRLLALKELDRIKSYSNTKQLDEALYNLHRVFDTLSSKREIIESTTSLITGLYHRFLTRFATFKHTNNSIDCPEQTIQSVKSKMLHKSTQCQSVNKSYQLGYLASLDHQSQEISGFNTELITNIRSYSNHNSDSQIDQLEFNKACMIYSKLSSSKYISINPKGIASNCAMDSKQLVNIIKMIPPLTELSSATNWKLNFYPSFGPLLEFVTTHIDEYYLVTSHNTIYPLKISHNNCHSLLKMIDRNLPIEQLASTVLYLLYNDQIGPCIEHLQHVFMNFTLDTLLSFIAIVPSELISTIYDHFLGNILRNRNLILDNIRFDRNLVINLYTAHNMGYLASLPHGIVKHDISNETKSVNDIIHKLEKSVSASTLSIECIKPNEPITPKHNADLNTSVNSCTGDNIIIDAKDARSHIEYIRRDKYGIGADQCKNDYTIKQNDRLSRILDKLSTNLYSSTNHILYELIQNADDNCYSNDIIPELVIVQTEGSVTLFNNEIGFSKTDVEAICDLANSSKIYRSLCTGKFGIGFRSVFTITNEPHIFSNGYQFKFTSNGIGKLIPQWIDNLDLLNGISKSTKIDTRCYNTIIYLPLITPVQFDITYNLILHLRKLRRLYFIQITADGIRSEINLKATNESITDTPLFIKKIFYNDKDFKYIQYIDTSSNIQLTFPIDNIGQFVYSTLPVGNFGLNFAINSNFNLTLDRSNLLDDQHNRTIVERIPIIFLNALDGAKKLDRKIYYSILSTFARNAMGLFSVLNSRFNELLNQSDIIPTDVCDYVKPSESIYLTQTNANDSQFGIVEYCVKNLITKGYLKSFIAANDIPHNLAMMLNLPVCDFWRIIQLFEQFNNEIDPNEVQDAICVLKIVQFFTNRNVNMRKQLINVVQKYIKFPYLKDGRIGCDMCNRIYIGDPKFCKNIFQLLHPEITQQFTNDFLLELGFNDAKDALKNFIDLEDVDLSQDLKFEISVELIKSIEITNGVVFNEKRVSFPIYGTYTNTSYSETISLPIYSCEIVPIHNEFYDMLIRRGYKLFIPNHEYQPQLSQLLLNNISNHLRHLLEGIQMDTELALEYFNFIKYLLKNIDKTNSNVDTGYLLVPLGKWTVSDGEMMWHYEHLEKIICTNSIKYFTKTPPEIINSQSMHPKTLLLLLKFLQRGDTLCQTSHSIKHDNNILLENIGNMWTNRSMKFVSNALLEALDSIYNQLSSSELFDHIIKEISESNLIFTMFQNKLTPFSINEVFINGVDDLYLPIQALSQIYTVDNSFWKRLNIEESPSVDTLIELLKYNSSLTIKSIISIVVYLYLHMDKDTFVTTVSNLNIIPGWHNHIRNKEVQGKIALLKPSEILTITQCADLGLFSMDKLQSVWYNIISNLTNLTYNIQINEHKSDVYCIEYENSLNCQANYLQTSYYDKYRVDVGLCGERIVYKYLVEKYGTSVKWLNESGEQGLPYDITFFKDGVEKFVEVKSSSSGAKKVFEISHHEWLFAQIKSEDFIIYRVNAVKSENPLITILPNPYYLWKSKKIAFCLSL